MRTFANKLNEAAAILAMAVFAKPLVRLIPEGDPGERIMFGALRLSAKWKDELLYVSLRRYTTDEPNNELLVLLVLNKEGIPQGSGSWIDPATELMSLNRSMQRSCASLINKVHQPDASLDELTGRGRITALLRSAWDLFEQVPTRLVVRSGEVTLIKNKNGMLFFYSDNILSEVHMDFKGGEFSVITPVEAPRPNDEYLVTALKEMIAELCYLRLIDSRGSQK